MTILAIDESRFMRGATRSVAMALGVGFREASNSTQAMEIMSACAEDVSLVVVSQQMQGVGGAELAARMQADPKLRRIPVLLLSAGASGDALSDVLKCGAASFLCKPFLQEELSVRIADLLELACVNA